MDKDKTNVEGITLTDEERKFLGFHLACRLEDYDKEIKKEERKGKVLEGARRQWQRLEELIYTKVIPESFHGPRPAYWSKQ